MNEPIVAISDSIMRFLNLLRTVPSLKASAHQELRRYPAFKEKMKPIPSSLDGRFVVPCVIMTAMFRFDIWFLLKASPWLSDGQG